MERGLLCIRRRLTLGHRLRVVHRVYNWSLWAFLVLLLLTQPLGFVWQPQSSAEVVFGRSPLQGIFDISGENDEPYTDRSIVCALRGRLYKPIQLSAALAAAPSSAFSSNVNATVNGYRVVNRHGLVLSAKAQAQYSNRCDHIASTLDTMISACSALGYNVTGIDHLRIVVNHSTIVELLTTLPVLILPYWDNANVGRNAIPSNDGSACIFRLLGKYHDDTLPVAYLQAVDREVRQDRTVEWLGRPGGTWSHGWYHDLTDTYWHSDIFSNDATKRFNATRRRFDMLTGNEIDCTTTVCDELPSADWWGKDLVVRSLSRNINSVAITNGKRRGLFLYDGTSIMMVSTAYRLENFITNFSMALLVFRWFVALLATHRIGETIGAGGAMSCARSFLVLPIMLLPRMKMILTAFFVSGCYFEGEQRSLSEAWFVMYPAIAEFTLLFYSVLNLAAKLLRRRASDALFGPTLVGLSALHYFRRSIAASGWFEMDGRVATVVTSQEFDAMPLIDIFVTDAGYRINGRISSLFAMKIALLAVHVLPMLIWSDNTSITHARSRGGLKRSAAEKTLALRVALNGGLGRSPMHVVLKPDGQSQPPAIHKMEAIMPLANGAPVHHHPSTYHGVVAVVPFEVIRAGYVVLGTDALVSTKDWFWFMVSAPLRLCRLPARHLRMVTLTIREESHGVWSVQEKPQMCRVTDERFQSIGALEISLRTLR